MQTLVNTSSDSGIGRKLIKMPFAALSNGIMILYSITCLYPVVWLFYSSFKTMREFDSNVIALPKTIIFDNYVQVFAKANMLTYIGNSMRNSVLALFFILLFAFVNGFFIARYKFRGRMFLYGFYMLGMLIPVHALLVPIYVLLSSVGFTNRWFTIPLPLICFNLPISLFLCEAYIKTIPKEIDEAASIDGAGFSHTLFGIILPMAKPILVTCGILAFFQCWNDFIFSLVLLRSNTLYTVPLGLTLLKGTYMTNFPVMMTAMLIGILPAMMLYFFFSEQIIKGMMSGAIKG